MEKALKFYKENLDEVVVYSNRDVNLSTQSIKGTIKELGENGISVKVFCNNNILDLINNDPQYAQLKNTFFNCCYYDRSWFADKLEKSIRNLGPRYIRDFNVELHDIEEIFDIFYQNESGKNYIRGALKEAVKDIDSYYLRDKVVQDLRNNIYNVYAKSETDIQIVFGLYKDIVKTTGSLEQIIEEKRGKNEDYHSYWRIKKIVESLDFSNNRYSYFNNKLLIVEGKAGTGKSHLLAHEAEKHSNKNNVLLLGHTLINDSDPEEQIKKYLEIDCSFLVFVRNLDVINSVTNSVSVIYFDAVNECHNRQSWRQYLKNLVFEVEKLSFVKLVFSIRSTYFEDIFDDDFLKSIQAHTFNRIVHTGFSSDPLYACEQFFKYYGLELNPLILLNQDYSNPLFLSIYCEAKSAGVVADNNDIFSIYERFVEKEEKEYKKRHSINDKKSFAEIVFGECIDLYLETRRTSFNKFTLIDYVGKVNVNGSFVDWLIRSNIFSSFLSDNEEYLYFNYELFFEYNVAKRIVSLNNDLTSLIEYCDSVLLIRDRGYFHSNNAVGIFAAVGVLAKKKHGEEIITKIRFEGLNDYSIDNLIKSYFNLYRYRNDSDIDSSFVKEYANEGIISFDEFLNICFGLIIRDCDLNIEYLHSKLLKFKLPERDYIWTLFVNDSYANEEYVYRVIKLFFENDIVLTDKKEEVSCLITWFLTSNNNEIRDKSTRALTKLLVNDPKTSTSLLNRFHSVNDPYVLERLCGSVYGAVLNSVITDKYKVLGETIFNYFFKDKVYDDILVRDYCSNTIDYLGSNGVAFDFDINKCYAPYPKQDIPDISVDLLNELYPKFDDKTYKENGGTLSIRHSLNPEYGIKGFSDSMYGDFGRYTFGSHLYHFKDLDDDLVYKYAYFYIVNDLGYSNKLFAEYDNRIRNLSRVTPLVERIGKKYQWISMYHTLALVMDKYNYEELYSNAEYLLCKGAWTIHCRDVDFSYGLNCNKSTNHPNPKRVPYGSWSQNSKEWCLIKDIPPFSDDLLYENKWLALHYAINDQNEDIPPIKQSVWRSVNAVFVKKEEYPLILESIRKDKLLYLFNESSPSETYNLFFREYGCTQPYFNEYQNYDEIEVEVETDEKEIVDSPELKYLDGEWILENSKKEVNIKKVIGKLIRSYSRYGWEAYKDSTIFENSYSLVPSRFLIDKMRLKQSFNYVWNDGDNDVVFDLSNLSDSNCSGLYIEKERLLRFLNNNNLAIVWLCFGNKLDYSGIHDGSRRDKQSIIFFDENGNLVEELLYEED